MNDPVLPPSSAAFSTRTSSVLPGKAPDRADDLQGKAERARKPTSGDSAVIALSAEARELASRSSLEAVELVAKASSAAAPELILSGPALPLIKIGPRADADATEIAGQSQPEETTEQASSPRRNQETEELRRRDAEVRSHEQAHKRAGAQYAGSIVYEYETGPDGKRYAVGGHVRVDVSPVRGDPEQTIRKMEQLVRAALAPGAPSAADRQVAARAKAVAERARAELTRQQKANSSFEARSATTGDTTAEGPAPRPAIRDYVAVNPSPGFGTTLATPARPSRLLRSAS